MGKASFLDIRDGSGKLQLQARTDELSDESYEGLLGLDLGDIVGVEGVVFASKRGELTLRVGAWELLGAFGHLNDLPHEAAASNYMYALHNAADLDHMKEFSVRGLALLDEELGKEADPRVEEEAEKRGAPILGALRGWGMSSDGEGEMVAPSQDGAIRALVGVSRGRG